jgi:ADP-ribosylglycohydrolase/catechol 2,3-dioxygenase-like lactoylglutathione lyase family enzyme
MLSRMSASTKVPADMGEPLTLDDVPTLARRATGAMLAAAVGDALGWPVEPRGNRVGGTRDLRPQLDFIEWRRREGGKYAPHERTVPAGTYSDDTQLMLAVARSHTLGPEWWEHLTQLELPLWTLYELGGGGAVRRAANSWARGRAPWRDQKDRTSYFQAGANGAVMRVLPHAIKGAHGPFKLVAETAMADGITTHGHPRALVGSLALAYALWKALRWEGKLGYGELVEETLKGMDAWGALPAVRARDWAESADDCFPTDYQHVWERTVEEMEGLLLAAREGLQRGSMSRDSTVLADLGAYDREGGAGTRTAAAGLYLAGRYVVRPPAGLLAAAFARRTDTDTIACVTGALLGALTGPDWLRPIARGLLDRDYITDLAQRLSDRRAAVIQRDEWNATTKRKVTRQVSALGRDDRLDLPLFGSSTVFDVERIRARSAHDVAIWWLRTSIGQTIALARISRASAQTRLRDGDAETSGTHGLAGREPRQGGGVQATSRSSDPPRRDAGADEPARWRQTQDREAPSAPDSTVAFALLVRDVERSVRLYCDTLRLPLGRHTADSAVIGRTLLLRREDIGRAGAFAPATRAHDWRAFETGRFVTVWMDPPHFKRAYDWLCDQSFAVSRVIRDSHRRFRFLDHDGHVVEVIARPD